MYEARQNKEKVSRRIDGGGIVRQRIEMGRKECQYIMSKPIQMEKKKYFNTSFTSMSYGVEQEISKYKVQMDQRTDVFAIIYKDNNELLLITADMGNNNKYTIELVSTPTEMSNENGRKDRIKSAKIAMSQIKAASDSESKKMEYYNEDGFELKNEYTNYKILDDRPDITNPLMSNQISIGVENSIEEIERIINIDYGWYVKDKYRFSSIVADPKIQFGYNYLMCIIEKITNIKNNKEDATSPTSKNSWGIMPRTNFIETVDCLFEPSEKCKFKMIKDKIGNITNLLGDEYKNTWVEICCGKISLGHGLNTSFINGKPSSIFEIRNPDYSWNKYFYSPLNDEIELGNQQETTRTINIDEDILRQVQKRRMPTELNSDSSDYENSDESEW